MICYGALAIFSPAPHPLHCSRLFDDEPEEAEEVAVLRRWESEQEAAGLTVPDSPTSTGLEPRNE